MRIENGIFRGLEKGFFDSYSNFVYYNLSYDSSHTYGSTLLAQSEIIKYIKRNK